jgi:hypothetical protein
LNIAAQLSMDKIHNNISKIYCAAIKFKYYGNQPISETLNSLTLEKPENEATFPNENFLCSGQL